MHGKMTTKVVSLIIVFVIALGCYIAVGTQAGTSDDPLISLSYFNDTVLPDLINRIDTKFTQAQADFDARIKNIEQNGVTSTESAFVSVQVKADQTILGHDGTEVIVRTGNATAVCPGTNGLVDTTAGLDLAGGKPIVNNHVYIIPREDGRGIKMKDDGYIMVKGSYDIG